MKIIVMPFGNAPDRYTISGEVITAHHGDQSESFDLSGLQSGDRFIGVEVETLALTPGEIIPGAYRDEQGELHVSLCERVIAGKYPGKKAHWRTGDEIDAAEYDPNTCYGVPTGMAGVPDYEIVQGVDVAGVVGWTVVKAEG